MNTGNDSQFSVDRIRPNLYKNKFLTNKNPYLVNLQNDMTPRTNSKTYKFKINKKIDDPSKHSKQDSIIEKSSQNRFENGYGTRVICKGGDNLPKGFR